jgi:AsmA protein
VLLSGLVFLLFAAGAGVGYLILNPPSDLIRQTIAAQVKDKTGRDLVVAGPAAFSFYPGLGVILKDVTLSGPPGSPAMLVKMDELDINIKTMPLLNRQIEVRRLILRRPVFDLRVDRQGRKNWTLAEASTFQRYAQAEATAPQPGDAGTTGAPIVTDAPPRPAGPGLRLPAKLSDIDHLQMDDVRIESGTLRYTDERTGKTQSVTAVNMKLNIKSLSSALTASGDFAWQGEKTEFNGKVSPVRSVLEEKPAQMEFAAKNRHAAANYDGSLHVGEGADLAGKLDIKGASVKGLAKWLGTAVPDVQGLGPFTIAGDLQTNGNVTSLSNAKMSLDGATATGNTRVTTGGVRPYVAANLQISELNLNKYLGSGGGSARSAPAEKAPAPARPAAKAGSQTDAGSIEDLIDKPATGPKVHGYTERAGWSNAPIDLSLFGVADTDAKLRVGRLIFQDIKVGQTALTVALKNKVLKTTFDNIQLYDGKGKGFLNVDATSKAPAIGANFGLDGLSALPFLKDAADMEWLSGKAHLALQLATRGGSQLQLVENLNGKADFSFADGALVGFNVAGAVRGISQGKFSALKKSPTEKTDFSELSATFKITDGIAQNQDLKLTSPLLRVSGAGAVQMPQRTLDYTVKPKLVASLEGQKGAANISGIEVPVRITGSWDRPKFEPDLKGLLSDPNKAADTVKQLGKQLKGKNSKEIVDGLLGKGDGTTGSTKSKAKDILNNLLKQQ